MTDLSCDYISCASNTISHALIWELNELYSFMVFASNSVLAVVDLNIQKIVCTLRGHTDRINGIIRIEQKKNSGQIDEFVSCSADGTLRVWRHKAEDPLTMWEEYDVISGLLGSIVSLATATSNLGQVLVACDGYGKIVTWTRSTISPKFLLSNILQYPSSHSAREIYLTMLPTVVDINMSEDYLMLCLGGVDSKIRLKYTKCLDLFENATTESDSTKTNNPYKDICILSGHEDWITCFCSTTISSIDDNTTNDKTSNGSHLLLASGSQDSKIRLWRFSPSISQNSDVSAADIPLVVASIPDSIEEEEEEVDELYEEGDDASNAANKAILPFEDDATDDVLAMFHTDHSITWGVYLEALLVGHEDWVTSVRWFPQRSSNTNNTNTSAGCYSTLRKEPLQLFSTSMDRNMVIWSADEHSGVWLPMLRVGDIGGSLGGSVAANLLGFIWGEVSPTGSAMIGVGYGGAFHLWSKDKDSGGNGDREAGEESLTVAGKDSVDDGTTSTSEARWRPLPFLTGHFAPVVDLSWYPDIDNACLVTVSSDQTCRLHAPVASPPPSSVAVAASPQTSSSLPRWSELSRPQIHGYDMTSVTITQPTHTERQGDDGGGGGGGGGGEEVCRIYTGSDEKVVRVLEAPTGVLGGLEKICGKPMLVPPPAPGGSVTGSLTDELAEKENISNSNSNSSNSNSNSSHISRVHHAYIPELGLSAKASNLMTDKEKQEQVVRGVDALRWTVTPLEGQLADHTLWPESGKLFGHNNDVLCLARSPCGRWLASSAKARDCGSAGIFVWNLRSLQCEQRLDGHDSSVVALRFSPDGRFLASAGKDRSICLFQRIPNVSPPPSDSSFVLSDRRKHAHKRIIWDLSWSSDSRALISGGRDGYCKLWAVQTQAQTQAQHALAVSTSSASASLPPPTAAPAADHAAGHKESVAGGTLQCVLGVTAALSICPFEGSAAVTSLDTLTVVRQILGEGGDGGAIERTSLLVACGSETGMISIWSVDGYSSSASTDIAANLTATLFYTIPDFWCHGVGQAVRKLRWGPTRGGDSSIRIEAPKSGHEEETAAVTLATCGDDHCIRIFTLTLLNN